MLNYKIYGEGPPLIILHGLFGMLDNWKSMASRLKDKYQVVLVDLRNHGRSPHHDIHNYDTMAKDLLELINSIGIEKVNVIGHSMGGKTAIQFAYQYPDNIHKLVVVDIAPKRYAGGHEHIIDALNSMQVGDINSRKEADDILSARIEEQSVRLFLLKNLKRSEVGFEWKMNLEVLSKVYKSEIMQSPSFQDVIETPTLFIKGGESNYIDSNDESKIQELFTNVKIVNVEGAGHWVHADKPDELEREIRKFI